MKDRYDVVVVGGGPAGLAAAVAAKERGAANVLVLERDREAGGILNQCIHNGFGLHFFSQELTGPEYAGRFIRMAQQAGVEIALNTMVLAIGPQRQVSLLGRHTGYRKLEAGALVLAMGCRERTRGAIAIPGTRPAGVLTAGAAQRYVNMEGYMPGRRVVILGSGDIGLIMARRMTLEGARVLACVEVQPYPGGLARNIAQCLEDYNIPLYLSHTLVDIRGQQRVEGVTVARVDENRRPLAGTEMDFDCDTVLLSVGLIPENELSRAAGLEMDRATGGAVVYENMETSQPGVFACGNALHVHDLVDFASMEGKRAGQAAADFALAGESGHKGAVRIRAGEGLGYTVPQAARPGQGPVSVFFRVKKIYGKSRIEVSDGQTVLATYRRGYMFPGEMEQISLPEELLARAAGGLSLRAVEDGQ